MRRFLARTDDLDGFFAELFGKQTGVVRGKGGSMHLTAPSKGYWGSSAIVASCIPVAVGAAFANRQKKTDLVSCVFFGDGATDEGVFWESLNAACLMKLPVLFVCEDNGVAVHTGTALRQGFDSITEVVRRFRTGVFEDDTTDVEQIYSKTAAALEDLETEKRPVFLRLRCYRYLEHVGIGEDFDAGYRSKNEYAEWLRRDPIMTQRLRLLADGIGETKLSDAERQAEERIKEAIARAKAASFPGAEELTSGVFYETH